MKSKVLLTALILLGFSLFIFPSKAKAMEFEDIPRMPTTGEEVLQWHHTSSESSEQLLYCVPVENKKLFLDNTYQSGNKLTPVISSSGCSEVQRYCYINNQWIEGNTTTCVGTSYAMYIYQVGSLSSTIRSTADVYNYNDTIDYGSNYNNLDTVPNLLLLNSNWTLAFNISNPNIGFADDWLKYHITFKTISPDTYSNRDHLRVSYLQEENCYIHSESSTSHFLKCQNFLLFDVNYFGGYPQVINTETSFKISSTSNICENILDSNIQLKFINGSTACNIPENIIDKILPIYEGINWEIPEDSWGAFDFLKEVFKTLFDGLDAMIEFIYNAIRTVVDFFVPDVYIISDFFNAQYNNFVNKFQIEQIIRNIFNLKDAFIEGLNTSFDPTIETNFHGINTTILDFTEFKNAYDNSIMKDVILVALVLISSFTSFKLVMNILRY